MIFVQQGWMAETINLAQFANFGNSPFSYYIKYFVLNFCNLYSISELNLSQYNYLLVSLKSAF